MIVFCYYHCLNHFRYSAAPVDGVYQQQPNGTLFVYGSTNAIKVHFNDQVIDYNNNSVLANVIPAYLSNAFINISLTGGVVLTSYNNTSNANGNLNVGAVLTMSLSDTALQQIISYLFIANTTIASSGNSSINVTANLPFSPFSLLYGQSRLAVPLKIYCK